MNAISGTFRRKLVIRYTSFPKVEVTNICEIGKASNMSKYMVVYFVRRKQDKYRHEFKLLINIGLIHNFILLLIHAPTQILLALDDGKYFYKMPGYF